MRAWVSKPGFAALLTGGVLLLHLAALGTVFTTDGETVSLLGNVLPETCSWKASYGIPCPTCGMTRGLVLASKGRLFASYEVNRSAPIFAAAALFIGLGLLGAGWSRLREKNAAADHFALWTQRIGLAGGGAWMFMLAGNWVLVLRAIPRI